MAVELSLSGRGGQYPIAEKRESRRDRASPRELDTSNQKRRIALL
jgi:hypothetical protein